MPTYASLSPPHQLMVDRLVGLTRRTDWATRRWYLSSAYHALGGETSPEQALAAIVAAMIERLGRPAVSSPVQAVIYWNSADPDHRAAADRWFADHPAVLALMRLRQGPPTIH